MIHTHLFFVLISVAAVLSQNQPPSSQFTQEEESNVNSIPGVAGKDYPIFHEIPQTNFGCSGKLPGYYADTDARCQVWHYCSLEGLVDSFLCPNGTIYSQERRVCEWYYDVDCTKSSKFTDVNKDLYIIPETTKAPSRSALEKQQLVKDPETPQLVKNSNLRKRYIQF
ncbi:hypothetical protein DAPPUDRAFT_321838 [Daphnia pulex]|uniref:Chitin-binding type-2 domain-containing protein n=1 Tax=Daphnia pulex TaxID=6669 RepID=E9GU25_DAPPU|nr:hypothetical protein DAPPUDRAFT_321838 [Daphnia pulex]|eukprot:EFX76962.1 hypothetical protein DAPPUDRAFT_321838 [Daphnia pulex]